MRFWNNELWNNEEGVLEKSLKHCKGCYPLPERERVRMRGEVNYFSVPTSAFLLSSSDTTRLHTSLPNFWKSSSWFFHSF
nr:MULTISPECIES: hypothetical protein [Enterobacteriaceae]